RARLTPIQWRAEDLPVPSFTGVRVLDKFPLATLRDFIDWSPFFHTWGLKGVYPRILEHEGQGAQARQIFSEANGLLDTIIENNLITARGVYGLFPPALWATMSNCTRTAHAKRCSNDSTSFASNQIKRAASRAGRSVTSSRRRKLDYTITSARSRLPAGSA